MGEKIDWLKSREIALRESLIGPSLRKTRLYLWIIGVITFSLMAVCWPLITGSGDKTPAFIFGGVEFILAGFVIMVAGVTDLLSGVSDTRPRARSLTILVGILLGAASLGFSARLEHEEHVPSAGYIAMAVTLFALTVICGTYAAWIAERGE